MTRKFVYTNPFIRSWKAMGIGDKELEYLEEILLSNPRVGSVIEGTGGARKMRIGLYAHGKRGGARVVYVDILEKEVTYLLFAYPKNVQDDLTQDQKDAINNLIKSIRKE